MTIDGFELYPIHGRSGTMIKQWYQWGTLCSDKTRFFGGIFLQKEQLLLSCEQLASLHPEVRAAESSEGHGGDNCLVGS